MNDVTVVVATRNRRTELERSLPRHETSVIVVDNASTDDIADVVLGHRDTGLIRLPDNRGAAARTVGALAATTPFVAFADDDSWWAPGALAQGAELLRRHPEVALLNARIVVGAEQRPDPVCGTMARSPLDSSGQGAEIGPRILGFVACATVVRRDAFLRVGGFDDVVRFPGEEERVAIDLAAAGWELRYAPELVVHHHPGAGRDRAGRQRAIVRSRILTAVMRRSWMCVMSRVGIAWHDGGPSRDGAHAALRDAPRALRERQAIPRSLEADLRLLEAVAAP